MQVAHQNDFITHAVIGGGETINFGISNSAEFFNILSSTLYKDQILAVVREVLCNAWDAHIEAGCTNKPVEITISEDKFVIKDFGTGIHKDDMGPIYGTYGNSTKKNDGMQTGGFGLGCKAPFAYTDHFEVVSCHDGVKTIYNLSKSSAAAMGKPGIVPIASFATEDTGLQVTIRIIKSQDRQRFLQLVKRIAGNGDMNMMLNGLPIEKIGFDTSVSNYLLTLDDTLLDANHTIMVRYGNVIYPVDTSAELGHEYRAINQHLETLRFGHRNYRIVFQAPPHSISVTPSRESLSMQEHTIKTLKSLFQGFLDTLKVGLDPACEEFAEASVLVAVSSVNISGLLSRALQLPFTEVQNAPTKLSDLRSIAARYMQANYPKSLEFRKKDISYRLKAMVTGGLLDRGIVQTYLRALKDVKHIHQHYQYARQKNDWLQRQVIAPLVTKLVNAGIDHTKLYGYDPEDTNSPQTTNHNKAPLVVCTKISPPHLFSALPYLRNIVVLTTSLRDIRERAKEHAVLKERGDGYGFLVYHVSMKKKEREAAIEFFKQTNMEVVDLTFRQEWEDAPVKPVVVVPRKPAKKGLVSLKTIKYGKGSIDINLSRVDNAERTEDPEFIILLSVRQGLSTSKFDRWDSSASRDIVDLFGDKGGITTNSLVHTKWLAKGVKESFVYIREKVCEYMMNSPTIQEYWAYHPDRAVENYRDYSCGLLELMYSNQALRSEFNLVNNLTETDKKYMGLWDQIRAQYRHGATPDDVIKVKEHLKAIPLAQANHELVEKFNDNKLLQLISTGNLSNVLRSADSPAPLVKKALLLLHTVLNNK